MAKLYFKFGTMGSSKTANALMTRFNYQEKDKSVWLIKPETDTRDDIVNPDGTKTAIIKSRIGLIAEADVIKKDDDIEDILLEIVPTYPVDAIICDECQFLSEEQVDQLKLITDKYDIPVLCFGLRSDFRTKLFPGSKRLFEIADSITELKSICRCGSKATVNARIKDGKVITEGNQVEIGGDEKYEAMCWHCWKEKIENNS